MLIIEFVMDDDRFSVGPNKGEGHNIGISQ